MVLFHYYFDTFLNLRWNRVNIAREFGFGDR